MERNLEAINQFVSEHWIDLMLPDADFRRLMAKPAETRSSWGSERRSIDFLFGTRLHRVFNNASFQFGGRFYGGWWQQVPRALRKYITINGLLTTELDYSNMQVAMLYAKKGLDQPDEDAYHIDGIATEYRPLIKKTVFKVINATGKIAPPPKRELPEGWTWRSLQEAVELKHKSIAEYFRTGIGLHLQRVDADIAEAVMLRLMGKRLLTLSIHDSFIVPESARDLLLEAMQEEYRRRVGRDIAVREDSDLSSDLVAKYGNAEGALTVLEQKPEYQGYVARRTHFLHMQTSDWRERHSYRDVPRQSG